MSGARGLLENSLCPFDYSTNLRPLFHSSSDVNNWHFLNLMWSVGKWQCNRSRSLLSLIPLHGNSGAALAGSLINPLYGVLSKRLHAVNFSEAFHPMFITDLWFPLVTGQDCQVSKWLGVILTPSSEIIAKARSAWHEEKSIAGGWPHLWLIFFCKTRITLCVLGTFDEC